MTVDNKKHDLHDFMAQVTQDIAAEYERIQKRAAEDPGTAGDQGEENWAEVLRGWLPPKYTVVTKGRIISAEGQTSNHVVKLACETAQQSPPHLAPSWRVLLLTSVGHWPTNSQCSSSGTMPRATPVSPIAVSTLPTPSAPSSTIAESSAATAAGIMARIVTGCSAP